MEDHEHDYDWFNPVLGSEDDLDEVLACVVCGRVKWTAQDIKKSESLGELFGCKEKNS